MDPTLTETKSLTPKIYQVLICILPRMPRFSCPLLSSCSISCSCSQRFDCICISSFPLSPSPLPLHALLLSFFLILLPPPPLDPLSLVFQRVGDLWRSRYGEYAGWAHTILFAADLTKFKTRKYGRREEGGGRREERGSDHSLCRDEALGLESGKTKTSRSPKKKQKVEDL
eukprot:339239-Hanusia_phi.AAC.1